MEAHVAKACGRTMNIVLVLFFHKIYLFAFLLSDINECQDDTVCIGGQCLNTDGSYICFCTHPMVLDPSSSNCVLMPESSGKCF